MSPLMTDRLLNDLAAGIDRVLPDAVALRREIHADPHLSGEEEPTRDRFQAAADWLDWSPVAHTGDLRISGTRRRHQPAHPGRFSPSDRGRRAGGAGGPRRDLHAP